MTTYPWPWFWPIGVLSIYIYIYYISISLLAESHSSSLPIHRWRSQWHPLRLPWLGVAALRALLGLAGTAQGWVVLGRTRRSTEAEGSTNHPFTEPVPGKGVSVWILFEEFSYSIMEGSLQCGFVLCSLYIY